MTTTHSSIEQDFTDFQTEQSNVITNNVSPGSHTTESDNEDVNFNLVEEVDQELLLVNSRRFNTRMFSVGTLYHQINESEVNMNPLHQRNESVHSNQWKSELILSLMKGMPLGEPEFDTVRRSNGMTYIRSLDGKQRITAITSYLEGGFKYCHPQNIPAAMMNKTYEEIPPTWKQAITNSILPVKVCDSTLSEDEIAYHFRKKQQSAVTTCGEKLNAMFSNPVIRFSYQLLRENATVNTCLNGKVNRKGHLEMIVRIIHTMHILDVNNDKTKIDTSPKKLISWVENFDATWFTRNQTRKITVIIVETFRLINDMDLRNSVKLAKTFILPIVGLFMYHSTADELVNADVSEFVSSVLEDEDYYEDVGGSHSATKDRFIQIKENFVEDYEEA